MDEHPRVNVPPTPVPGLDLRTWLAGCALANANVITTNDPELAARQAVIVADNMLSALKSRPPTRKSMRAPTVKEMKRWETQLAKQNERNAKDTLPAIKRKATKIFEDAIPDPNRIDPPRPPNGRYSMIPDSKE